MTSHDCAVRPEIDERVDVAIERIGFRKNVQHAMNDHVSLESAHEKEGERARVATPDHASVHRSPEVIDDDRETAARRAVGSIRIEGNDQ